MKILFICTGNTCRSIMAEALAKKWLIMNAPERRDIQICSAGLAAFAGSEASYQAIEVMGEKGINLTGHRARLFNGGLAEEYDLLIAMTQNHKEQILRRYPGTLGKVFTLNETCENNTCQVGAKDIADPFGQRVEVYRECARNIEGCINSLLSRVVGNTNK